MNRDLQLKRKLCAAIKNRNLIQFIYQSKNDDVATKRIIEPYLIVITENGNGKYKLVGCPVNKGQNGKDELGHYLFDKLNIDDIVILPAQFHKLRVSEEKVFNTPTVKVVCIVKFL